MTDLKLSDFNPFSNWHCPDCSGTEKNAFDEHWIKDLTSDRVYLNEDKWVTQLKCFLLVLGTPVVHSIMGVISFARNFFKLITFYHFWAPKKTEYFLKDRAMDFGLNLLGLVTKPLAIVGLEFAALYGASASPYDGRKLYASFERFLYNDEIYLAPCFQPSAKYHLFGGDIRKRNQW